MKKILSDVMDDFVKVIMFLLVAIISLSSFCKKKPEENYLEPINVSNNTGRSENPSIAVDSRNTVHLVWNDDTPGNEEILYAYKPASGNWSSPTNISNTLRASRYPCIAVDKNDVIHLVWQDCSPDGFWRVFYSQKSEGDTWAIPETISIYGASAGPVLAVDDDLGLHLFWTELFGPDVCHHYYAYRPFEGQWEIRYLFTSSITDYEMKVDKNKGVHIVVEIKSETYYIEKRPDGTWTDTIRLSWSPTNWQLSMWPSLAVENDGSLHIVWYEGDTALKGICYIKRTSNREWQPIIAPYKNEDWRNYWGPASPMIGKGKSGKLYVVWRSAKVGYGVKVGEVWERAKTVVKKTGGNKPTLAIDYQEYIHVAWPISDSLTGWQNEIYYIEFKP